MKKYFKIATILIILVISYLYISNITLIPKSITLLQGEKLELATLWGINLKQIATTNPNIGECKNGSIIEASTGLEETKLTQMRQNRYGSETI